MGKEMETGVSEAFKKLVFEKAEKMIKDNTTEDVLDQGSFSGLRIFIDVKPQNELMSFVGAEGTSFSDKVIYVGG